MKAGWIETITYWSGGDFSYFSSAAVDPWRQKGIAWKEASIPAPATGGNDAWLIGAEKKNYENE